MRVYIIVVITLFCAKLSAQDPHFSQFYANPLYLSPSLAGATDGGRIALNYRDQWPGITEAFKTFSFSFDNFFNTFNSGLGFYLIRDKAGSAGLTSTNAAFQYSYNLQINDIWQVIPAVQFEFANKSIDFKKLILGYESSGGGGSSSWDRLTNESVNYFDLASSLLLYSSKYWVGVTLNHLGTPNYTFLNEEDRLPIKGVLFGGVNIWSEKSRRHNFRRSFSTSFRFQHQSKYNQLDIGAYWHNDPLELGIWYRGLPMFKNVKSNEAVLSQDESLNPNVDYSLNQDAIVVLLGYNYGSLRFGYSYDISISGLGWQSAGAHEISLVIEFNQKMQLRGGKRPAVPCSSMANPLNNPKYRKKQRRIF